MSSGKDNKGQGEKTHCDAVIAKEEKTALSDELHMMSGSQDSPSACQLQKI